VTRCVQTFCWKTLLLEGDSPCTSISIYSSVENRKNHILSFMWSAQSLDKNIIENMWKVIKSHVQKELSAINPRQNPIKSTLTIWSKVY